MRVLYLMYLVHACSSWFYCDKPQTQMDVCLLYFLYPLSDLSRSLFVIKPCRAKNVYPQSHIVRFSFFFSGCGTFWLRLWHPI